MKIFWIFSWVAMCSASVQADEMLYGPYLTHYVSTVDGDTFHMTLQIYPEQLVYTKIRDRTIDTPEKRAYARYSPPDCEKELAKKASLFAEQIMEKAKVIYVHDLGTGSYPNRKIATIYIDGEPFGQKMIAAGYAVPYKDRRKKPWC